MNNKVFKSEVATVSAFMTSCLPLWLTAYLGARELGSSFLLYRNFQIFAEKYK